MSSLPSIQNGDDCLLIFPPKSGAKKWALTLFAASILALSVLAIGYCMCAFTPLAHSWSFLAPVANLAWIKIAALIVLWSAVSASALTAVILIHKKPSNSFSFVPPDTLNFLKEFELNVEGHEVNFGQIESFLREGYSNYLDYYGFYYHLSRVTKSVASDQGQAVQWKSFLKSIHDTPIFQQDGKRSSVIDCSVELDRLDAKKSVLCIEEFKKIGERTNEELVAIHKICLDAFPEWPNMFKENEIPEKWFFGENKRPFVIRNAANRTILGVILLEEKAEDGTKSLYISTLARSASAVDMGVTEKLKEHFLHHIDLKAYSRVWCAVRRDNKPALYIYGKLGFKVFDSTDDAYYMDFKESV